MGTLYKEAALFAAELFFERKAYTTVMGMMRRTSLDKPKKLS